MAVLDSRQWSTPLLDQTILLHHSFRGRKRSGHRDRCNECCKGRLKFHASVSLKGSHTLENTVAAIGRHRLGAESDEYPGAKGRAYEGRGIRSCPIFPELRSILDEAFEIFGDKSE